MSFQEILSREDANRDRVYLYKVAGFLRAYEHSAYLFHRFVHPFKLSCRFIKEVNRNVISLAFPEASLERWLHSYPHEQVTEKVLSYDIGRIFDEVEYHDWYEVSRIHANPGDRYTVYTSVIENQPVYKTAYDALIHILQLTKNVEKNMKDPFAMKAKHLSYSIVYAVRFFRQHHLDELPQLWNVLRGDMSFIGYRPERPFYISQIIEQDPRYRYLYLIRPGVTSYATLYNGYTDSLEKMLRRLDLDLYYLRNHSLLFDAKVLGLTFLSIVGGKKF